MKRFACLMVLAALTTPAHAGSYSFVIGGRHIHLEASRHCRSLSCVSWSEIDKKRDRDDTDDVNTVPAPAKAPVATAAAAPVQQPAPATAPAVKPVETRAMTITPAVTPLAQPAPQAAPVVAADAKVEVKEEPKPRIGFDLKPDAKLEPKIESKVETKPVEPKVEAKADPKPDTTASVTKAPAEKPQEKPQADKPVVAAKPAPSKSSLKSTLQSEGDSVEAPIGDWQTEGRKGLVRIEPCGTALCGYMINTSSNAKGETVLINMKPRTKSDKANFEWSGSIYSRASGNTYYATMTIKKPNTLRVEACVVGHYFCSGNNWTRIAPKPDDIVSPRDTREASAEPVR